MPPGKSEIIVFDDDIPLFGFRVRAGGSRTWIFQYRQGGKQRRMSLGSATAINAQVAREQAAKLHALVKLGHDPAGQKLAARAQASETFAALLGRYLAHKKASLRPRSFLQVDRHLTRYAKRMRCVWFCADWWIVLRFSFLPY